LPISQKPFLIVGAENVHFAAKLQSRILREEKSSSSALVAKPWFIAVRAVRISIAKLIK
jgi:hypothetical protein